MVCSSNISLKFWQFFPSISYLCNTQIPFPPLFLSVFFLLFSLSLMADHTRSHTTTDLYKILGIPIKDICKGFMKWNPSEKSPRNKAIEGGGGGGGGDRNFTSIKDPDKVRNQSQMQKKICIEKLILGIFLHNQPQFMHILCNFVQIRD